MLRYASPWTLASIARQAHTRPSALAVKDNAGAVSYAELWTLAGAVAQSLADIPGPRVAIAAERGRAFVIAALGAWRAGRAYVPLDLLNPVARLRLIVDDSRPAAVLVSGENRGTGTALGVLEREIATTVEHPHAPDLLSTPDMPAAEETGDPAAYVMYTSGTTGAPKGVVVGHASLTNLLRFMIDRYHIGPDDRSLHVCSVGFDASMMEIWPLLAVGGSVVACADADRVRPEALADQAERERCTVSLYPTGLANAALAAGAVPAGMRILFFGGDRMILPVPAPVRPLLVNVYGPTESTVSATMHDVVTGKAGDEPPIGQPIRGVSVRLCDPAGHEVPPGQIGELYVGGASLAHGYLDKPDLTEQRFVALPDLDGRWYRTGDLVSWDGGVLIFHGRADQDQLKVRGVRVEAGEIEAALIAHDQVRAAAVTVVDTGEARVVVAVLVAAGDPPSDRSLRRHLMSRLPAYLLPDRFLPVDALPLTANGKLDRAEIAALAARPH